MTTQPIDIVVERLWARLEVEVSRARDRPDGDQRRGLVAMLLRRWRAGG